MTADKNLWTSSSSYRNVEVLIGKGKYSRRTTASAKAMSSAEEPHKINRTRFVVMPRGIITRRSAGFIVDSLIEKNTATGQASRCC